jgi:ABC-type sugar transport system ATPase subunit
VRFERVTKTWPGGAVALRALDLETRDGELLVLVGPSGCGKSTALRIAAGLERPSAGRVWIGGEDVTERAARERDVAMVFQSYALYPHKSVRENLAFPLRMKRVSGPARAARVAEVAELLGLAELLDRRPRELSGGQRQRVALGRAMVREPRAFLLDEPLSNLDATLRIETRAELARLHRRLGATMLYVTHDQEEALTLGQRVALLRAGALEQLAPPLELYARPATEFAARFVGSPAMNVMDAEIEDGRVVAAQTSLDPPARWRLPPVGTRVRLGIRPHDLALTDAAAADVRGRIDVVEPLGSATVVHLTGGLVAVLPPGSAVAAGDAVALRVARERLHLFSADGRRLPESP